MEVVVLPYDLRVSAAGCSRVCLMPQVDAAVDALGARQVREENMSTLDKLFRDWAQNVVPTPLKPLLGMATDYSAEDRLALE